ncbi:MAG: DUF6065 family protein [Candidatus Promineifilaceae bacterium]
MLHFSKALPYIPDPRPIRAADWPAALRPTLPEPLGWILSYGYLSPITISGRREGQIRVHNLEVLIQETGQPHVVDQFAPGHFGIGVGLTLQTAAGVQALFTAVPEPLPGLEAVTGLIETDWYPRQLFLVFRVPQEGSQVRLERGAPLAAVFLLGRPGEDDANSPKGHFTRGV